MNSMNYIGKFISNFRDFYNEINTATLTGAIDVVVIEQPDGTFSCSPFHVRFGKLGVLRSREKVVDMEVNGEPLDIHMKLGESGEAFFVEKLSVADLDEEEIPPHLACSPIPSDNFLSQHPLCETIELVPHKTFGEETPEGKVSEKVRRISLVSREFHSIDARLEAEMGASKSMELSNSWNGNNTIGDNWNVPPNTRDNRWSCVDKPNDQAGISEKTWGTNSDVPVEGVRVTTGATGKRKRKKKSLTKKKGSSKKGGGKDVLDQETTDNMFVIDDLDQYPAPVTKPVPMNLEPTVTSSSAQELHMAKNNFHFFSDTELTPESSPAVCPSSPAQSDTELECIRHSLDIQSAEEGQSWRWGELPSPPPRPKSDEQPSNSRAVSSDAQRSMLSGMFSFMKKTKRLRRGEGMYLADINLEELDPEVAALYFPSSYHQHQGTLITGEDDDCESGNGTSLPHSPQSVDGVNEECKLSDTSIELIKHSIFDDNAAMSLCGGLEGPGPSNEAFMHGLVTYEDLCLNPKLLESPELVVRLGGKYYSWEVACSVVMSAVLYQRPLPQSAVDTVCKSPKDAKGGYSSWFSWRRPVEAKLPDTFNGKSKCTDTIDIEQHNLMMESTLENVPFSNESNVISQTNIISTPKQSQAIPVLVGSNQREKYHDSHLSNGSSIRSYEHVHRKTLRLSSEQIVQLKLKEGANEVMFSVTTAYQGTTRCKCHIYKWRYDDRIVISDIDGTITKSDVLGHILPIVGKDWAQSGVAQLFTKIKNNGYKLLYLSARAIGQARVTREYLRSIKQGDLSLPDGPLLLNPTSLVSAFHREVIERKPEEFKISCLRDIQALFPADTKPFYAGYGNKVNDVWAYRAVGIPIFRIFTINHRGELKHELTQTFQSSYSNLSYIVDQMFPLSALVEASEDFSSFIYWRDPIPDVAIVDICTPKKKTSHLTAP